MSLSKLRGRVIVRERFDGNSLPDTQDRDDHVALQHFNLLQQARVDLLDVVPLHWNGILTQSYCRFSTSSCTMRKSEQGSSTRASVQCWRVMRHSSRSNHAIEHQMATLILCNSPRRSRSSCFEISSIRCQTCSVAIGRRNSYRSAENAENKPGTCTLPLDARDGL